METGPIDVDLNSFRNHLPNVDDKNKRKWIYAKKPKGKFHNYRVWVTSIFLALLIGIPFIKINGHPFLMLNIFERKFIILGNIFWPQDTSLLIFLLLIFFVFIILFTVAFGRVWCGWACPQTLFMEMVFRKIEYLIEGDYHQQIKLNKGPKDFNYVWRKTLKHFIFVLVAIIIAHTVMAYLIGIDQTLQIITHPPQENMAGFIGLIAFSAIFYLVFSVVREVACTVICPYGRLQGVLINKDTSIIAYDTNRGEPRGKHKKNDTATNRGACVDCGLCVHVCPTGIDIRNGAQMECVNCTACIDVCDEVMVKTHQPKGLIRYASLHELQGQKTKKINVRTIAYSTVLSILVGVFLTLVFTRTDIETTVLRIPGQLYQKTQQGDYTNMYNIQVVNKTYDSRNLEFKLANSAGTIQLIGSNDFKLDGQSKKEGVLLVQLPKTELKGLKTKIIIDVFDDGKKVDRVKASFVGPVTYN
jgi:cytochrome c oxidase accessory protein FixG